MSDNQMAEKKYSEYDNYSFHPYNVLLTLLLFGITVLFLSISAAFVYTRVQSQLPPIRLPGIFFFNTLILLASSGTMVWAKKAYLEDNTAKYQRPESGKIYVKMQTAQWEIFFKCQGKDHMNYIDDNPQIMTSYGPSENKTH